MSSTKRNLQLKRNSTSTHTSSISWRMVRSICFALKSCIFVVSLSVFLTICFASTNTITMNDSISGEETIISAGQKFQLGFFNTTSGSKYVGIWYYMSYPKICVWVANRDTPLNNANGVFRIAEDGNLALFDESNNPIWKTNLPGWDSFKRVVQLLDSGNLVLKREDEESRSSRVIWESFKNPTDTFLPGMKMDENLVLVSWKGQDDPAQGEYKFQQEGKGKQKQFVIKKEGFKYHWKSRVGGNFLTDDILPTVSSLLSNSSRSNIDPGTLFGNKSTTTSSNFSNSNTRLVINSDGKVEYFTRPQESAQWKSNWSQPMDRCDEFRACGDSASCSYSKNRPMCKCLTGFEPILRDKWESGNFSEGCRRITPLCSNKVPNFCTWKVIKVGKPNGNFEVDNEDECKDMCLKDCKCQAYSCTPSQSRERKNTTCWIWLDDLNNIQLDEIKSDESQCDDSQLNSTDGELKIRLRVEQDMSAEANQTQQEGDDSVRNKQFNQRTIIIAVIVVASVTALAFTVVYIHTRKVKVKNPEDRGSNLPQSFYDGQRHVKELIDSGQLSEEDKKNIDLPFFDFESILAATNNFSDANKLGKGGFGPVYKGKFSGGQEIAVKRLSRVSGQGLEEFKNEVVLIARLQHRNLVRLLGYCIEGDEKILLYEFMPNKSLDFFIFDSNLNELLDWDMRFNIILGVARGLLYLHQDSRLRIIHRDLKISNILLDEEMNPKISDFGLARIFEGKQTEGMTNRVVGTYGYMSPEYALDGFFSIKSDVFSFGVVILEIISGKKNTGFYNSQEALSLLGYAWRLWQEDKALDMMEKKLSASSNTRTHEILKCINVGLLCVQEDPDDRPTMSDVVILLSSATAALPAPKRPAFVMRRVFHTMASSSSSKVETSNEMTVTLEGR